MSFRNITLSATGSTLLVLAANCGLLAQSGASEAQEFEVVSVKPHIPASAVDRDCLSCKGLPDRGTALAGHRYLRYCGENPNGLSARSTPRADAKDAIGSFQTGIASRDSTGPCLRPGSLKGTAQAPGLCRPRNVPDRSVASRQNPSSLTHPPLNEICIELASHKIRLHQNPLMQWNRSVNPLHHKKIQRPLHPLNRLRPIPPMRNQLRHQRIIIRRNHPILIRMRIHPYPNPARQYSAP